MNDRPGLRQATGRDYDEWFTALDEWGAPGKGFREISDWLTGEHGFSTWWAQKVIVEYEQARGIRRAGVRPDGSFTAGASKTVAVGVDRLYDAFADPAVRDQWLPGVRLTERTVRAGRSARYDWDDDGSRLSVTFAAAGDAKSQVGVEHERLPDAAAADERRAFWRERLAELKTLLEG
jgi:YD repeat-containing protein